jgi:membrane protease YdiL (CAAX protease family)
MFFKEFLTLAIIPITNLTSPSSFGRNADRKFVIHAVIYAVLISLTVICGALLLQPSLKAINELYASAMLAGALLLPVAVSAIGFILHLSKPIKAKKHRLLIMVALPWHLFTSLFVVMMLSMLLGVLYATTQADSISNPALFVTSSISKIIYPLVFFCFISFVQGLKNLRGTSAFQNLGDATIISAILMLPWAYASFSL